MGAQGDCVASFCYMLALPWAAALRRNFESYVEAAFAINIGLSSCVLNEKLNQ